MRRLLVICALAGASAVRAHGATASRLYDEGKYAEALARYQQAAQKRPDNWPLQYDRGAAAYKAGQYPLAAKAFERALATTDKELQAKALYNLGNTRYRLGNASETQSPEQRLALYKQALQSYESALAAAPADPDAKFNRELVQKKIEELEKKQQQQQQQLGNDKDQDKKQQPKDQDQTNKQQQQQDKGQDKKQTQDQPKQPQGKPEPQTAQPPPKPEPAGESKPGQPAGEPKDYQQVEAQQLLDRLREDERMWNFYPELQKQLPEQGPPAKDW